MVAVVRGARVHLIAAHSLGLQGAHPPDGFSGGDTPTLRATKRTYFEINAERVGWHYGFQSGRDKNRLVSVL